MLKRVYKLLHHSVMAITLVSWPIGMAVSVAKGQASSAHVSNTPTITDLTRKPQEFDVASFKLNNSKDGVPVFRPVPDGVRVTYCTVQNLVAFAYGPIQSGERGILGVPKWAASERYDAEAKVSASDAEMLRSLNPDQRETIFRFMFRTVLADRLNLAVHRETRAIPIFELVLSRRGSKMATGKPDDPSLPNGTLRITRGKIVAAGISMQRLAGVLGVQVQRQVIDSTDLAGTYNFVLEWEPEKNSESIQEGVAEQAQQESESNSLSKPSIFAALQEQLGLKLKSTKGQDEILVIDHIERPSPN